MDNGNEVREFLTSRRAKVTPDQAGLPRFGDQRRVPGLRRGEVAMLAGVSSEYYTRLERGNLGGVSDSVLEAVATALQLTEAEHGHLFDLARAAGRRTTKRRLSKQSMPMEVRPVVQRTFYPDWEVMANNSVALLRTKAGRNPYDQGLTDLVGQLSTRSEEFRTRWAAHNVHLHRTGVKHFQHPVVGRLDLDFESLDLTADSGLTLIARSAEPGTDSDDSLRLLASWAATSERGPAAQGLPAR